MIAVTGATGGVGGRVARALATQGRAVVAGTLVPPSDTVRAILGRRPRTLAGVLREHPETMAHPRR